MAERSALVPLRELAQSGSPEVRAYATLGLGRARDRASAGLLRAKLRGDRSTAVQVAAAWGLGRLGGGEGVSPLLTALRRRPGIVAVACALSLGAIGDVRAERALVQALFDPDPRLREAVARALRATSAGGNPLGASHSFFPVPTSDAASYVRAILAATGDSGMAPDLAALRPALMSAATDGLRGPVERVLPVLEVLSSRSAGLGLGALTADLDQWPADVRDATLRHLNILAEALVPELALVATHPDPDARAHAVRVLARIPNAAATAAVVRALMDDEEVVLRAALRSLETRHAGSRGIAEPVARILREHSDWSARTLAAQTLGRIGDRGQTGQTRALTEALRRDSFAFVREAAARALGEVGDPSGVPSLREALFSDPEPRVRRGALRGLRSMDDPAAARVLEEAASSADPLVQGVLSQ